MLVRGAMATDWIIVEETQSLVSSTTDTSLRDRVRLGSDTSTPPAMTRKVSGPASWLCERTTYGVPPRRLASGPSPRLA
jgi:hypothetical protein